MCVRVCRIQFIKQVLPKLIKPLKPIIDEVFNLNDLRIDNALLFETSLFELVIEESFFSIFKVFCDGSHSENLPFFKTFFRTIFKNSIKKKLKYREAENFVLEKIPLKILLYFDCTESPYTRNNKKLHMLYRS